MYCRCKRHGLITWREGGQVVPSIATTNPKNRKPHCLRSNIPFMLGLQRNVDTYMYQLTFTAGLHNRTYRCTTSQSPLTPASGFPPIQSQETPTSGTSTRIHADAPTIGTPVSRTPTIGQSKQKLLPTSEIVTKYPYLREDSNTGELAATLARESFFGKELMRWSTVLGFKDYPPLPADGVQALKQTILSVCPEYQQNPRAFESLWRINF